MVIRELDLVKLGFNKVVVSEEESGTTPYYFYEYPLSEENENFVLVSEDSDEIKDDAWRVQLYVPLNARIAVSRRCDQPAAMSFR